MSSVDSRGPYRPRGDYYRRDDYESGYDSYRRRRRRSSFDRYRSFAQPRRRPPRYYPPRPREIFRALPPPPYPMYPASPVRAVQPMDFGGSQLSPVASRSLLTCNNDFRAQFPHVYSGLVKGIIDVERLIAHEIVIPIKEDININKTTARSERAVTSLLSGQLWKSLHGKFPDPSIGPRVVRKVSEHFYDKIESAIREAEQERSLLQWMGRADVNSTVDVRLTSSVGAGSNSVICNIEGSIQVRRKKGEFLSLAHPDSVVMEIDVIIKALFLNCGQLKEMNNDPIFSDRVQLGENRFANQFVY